MYNSLEYKRCRKYRYEKLNQFYCSVGCLYSNSDRLRKAERFLKAKLCRRLFLYLSLKYLRKDFHYLN